MWVHGNRGPERWQGVFTVSSACLPFTRRECFTGGCWSEDSKRGMWNSLDHHCGARDRGPADLQALERRCLLLEATQDPLGCVHISGLTDTHWLGRELWALKSRQLCFKGEAPPRDFLVLEKLRFHPSTAGGPRFDPGQGQSYLAASACIRLRSCCD